MEPFDYDLFVIGAGSGGVRACRIAASLGARVDVAEERYFGGTCVNVGCVPKKVMFMASSFLEDAEFTNEWYGIKSNLKVDWPLLKASRDLYVKRLNGIYEGLLKDTNLVRGFARFVENKVVEVEGQKYTADHILIATGSKPNALTFPGADLVKNSNDFFDLEDCPKSALVIGGGYIAVELS